MMELTFVKGMPFVMPDQFRVMQKPCRCCGATFATKSRIKKRCDVCQAAVNGQKKITRDAGDRA